MTNTATYVLLRRGWTVSRSLEDNGEYHTETIELVPSGDDADILGSTKYRAHLENPGSAGQEVQEALAISALRNLKTRHEQRASYHMGLARLMAHELNKFA